MDENYNITSAQYIDVDGVNGAITAVINGQTWCVPIDTGNTQYQAILDWVADGNTIQDAA